MSVLGLRGSGIVPITPETSVYLFAIERAQREIAEALSSDLFGPKLLDAYGKPIRADR